MNCICNKTRSGSCISYLVFCICLILLFACDRGSETSKGSSADTGSVNFGLRWENPASNPAQISSLDPGGDVCANYDIDTINASLYNASSAEVASESWPCDAHQGTLRNVRTGSGMRLAVEAVVSGIVLWRGEILDITVSTGTNNVGQVTMTYIGSDTTPPEVVSTTPVDGAAGILDLEMVITATFSEDVGPAGGGTGFTLMAGATPVSGTVTYDDATWTATFTPDGSLSPATTYTAIIAADVDDKAGNLMGADYTWSFTTSWWNFDDGTLQGWEAVGLWHVTSNRFSSSPNSVWYGDEILGHYDTGASNFGTLVSPDISLGAMPTLFFDYFLDNECGAGACGYDELTVEISQDAWATWDTFGPFPKFNTGFSRRSIDLSAYVDDPVNIRFRFDTWDEIANFYEGAYVDNVILSVPLPDLTVTITDVTADGSDATVFYTVYNNGSADAGTFEVHAWSDLASPPVVGDEGDGAASFEELPLGSAVTGFITIPTDQLSGTAYAVVDSNQEVQEMFNEDNNVSAGYCWHVRSVALFANTAYVDYSPGNADSEASNLEATINNLGLLAETFTGITAAAITEVVAGKDFLIIPELENGNLNAVLDAAAREAVDYFIMSGGTLMMFADWDGQYITLLNSFGFALSPGSWTGPYNLIADNAGGTVFANGPASLPWNDGTYDLATASLPLGARSIYDDGLGSTAVVQIPYGDGRIIILCWDWWNAVPMGSQDGGWVEVLHRALSIPPLNATDRGWWDATGYHDSTNNNTYTGYIQDDVLDNSYFIFDLTDLTECVTEARLRLELESWWSPDSSESFLIRDVSTNAETLEASGEGQTDIFQDLQTGRIYGRFTVSSGDVGSVIEIPLRIHAVSDINAASGGPFAVGIHLVTYSGQVADDEGVRFSSGSESRIHQLVLTTE